MNDQYQEEPPVISANIKQHVLVCTGKHCLPAGGEALLEQCREMLNLTGHLYGKRGSMEGTVLVSKTGCTGLCKAAPVALLYPQGVWYARLTKDKLAEIIEKHIIGGQPVVSLQVKQIP